jgi:DNA-binding transcriptional regulator YdaS (Cro superfamily)
MISDELLARYQVTRRQIAVSLGVTTSAVGLWVAKVRQLPPRQAIEIERKFGIPRHLLREDLWEPPPEKPARRRTEAA